MELIYPYNQDYKSVLTNFVQASFPDYILFKCKQQKDFIFKQVAAIGNVFTEILQILPCIFHYGKTTIIKLNYVL